MKLNLKKKFLIRRMDYGSLKLTKKPKRVSLLSDKTDKKNVDTRTVKNPIFFSKQQSSNNLMDYKKETNSSLENLFTLDFRGIKNEPTPSPGDKKKHRRNPSSTEFKLNING